MSEITEVELAAARTDWGNELIAISVAFDTEGIEAALAAVAMGAKIVEKHITLNKNLPGPDHKASIMKKELKMMVKMKCGGKLVNE